MVPPGGTPWGTVSFTFVPFGARAMMVTPGRAFRGTRTSKVMQVDGACVDINQ